MLSAEHKGKNVEVTLTDTVIFPTGGGQPSDVGTLTLGDGTSVRVRECVRRGLDAVHLCENTQAVRDLKAGTSVRVRTDFAAARRDHMVRPSSWRERPCC